MCVYVCVKTVFQGQTTSRIDMTSGEFLPVSFPVSVVLVFSSSQSSSSYVSPVFTVSVLTNYNDTVYI